MAEFQEILTKYRKEALSQREKGGKFEALMQRYLLTDRKYSFTNVWLWGEFPYRQGFGGQDIGIDLVALDENNEYWAVQCKFYEETTPIQKSHVDTFLSASGKSFATESDPNTKFTRRIWISTSGNWSVHAEEALHNQTPPVTRLNTSDLENSGVDWEKLDSGLYGKKALSEKKHLRDYQEKAVNDTLSHLQTHDRGKLIMACGTGKTFTSLRIAEAQSGTGGLVLFLVPSIALLGQTLNEWSAQSEKPLKALCICSDAEVSKKKTKNDDSTFSTIDLALPATTHVPTITKRLQEALGQKEGMTVVFSTYQSIAVISQAQKELAKNRAASFDLVICDEAHRTTGVTLADEDESEFVRVHDNNFIQAKKRLYMTATPRLYDDNAKVKAGQINAELCSMDDEKLYGKEIYRIGFGEAVEKGMLSDYKVLILSVNENSIPSPLQNLIAGHDSSLNTDDASKLVGCINGLSKRILGDEGILAETDPLPMRRAVAFCSSIKSSKEITDIFNDTAPTYYNSLSPEVRQALVRVSSQHIDGTMNASRRDELLSWLKSQPSPHECRVLTNVRCLSEGVDVPSLDAVLFLSARNSQVDVVQSVGRVMRRAEGKRYGYIIIPILVPSNIPPEQALADNNRYKVVWTVLNALRAHDDRFNAMVNKIELNKKRDDRVLIGTVGDDADSGAPSSEKTVQLTIPFLEYQNAIYAKMVQKVGDRLYWENWAKNIAEIAERHVERIARLVLQEGPHKEAFTSFLAGLHKNINPNITGEAAIEMLAQHLITRPVFEALFEGYSFAKNNPVSQSMQDMIDILEEQALDKERDTLERFYADVRRRAEGIDNAEGKQRIIIELYDKFFKNAFPKMAQKLGIVYTPVECVDFIIRSSQWILQKHFQRSLGDEGVHILDPFTGTGTFMVRLLQSGFIPPAELPRKYQSELHANEIVLLAYYIASVNIEQTYHDLIKGEGYQNFEGICLTDTFQLTEDDSPVLDKIFPENSARLQKQKKAPITVIMGNPPYSGGQKNENDNNKNEKHPKLDKRVMDTYVDLSTTTSSKSTYDPFYKAFRWATDRLGNNGGLIAYITNGSWLDGNASDGFRKCLEEEFSHIYVFNLRGNANTSGETRKKEAGGVFGEGSRAPIAITFLVKEPSHRGKAQIHYRDIGDYLNRREKLDILANSPQVDEEHWQKISPNEHGDWLSKRTGGFDDYIPLCPQKRFTEKNNSFFQAETIGSNSSRDPWVCGFSKSSVTNNMKRMIDFYNNLVSNYEKELKTNPLASCEPYFDQSGTNISWSRALKTAFCKLQKSNFNPKYFVKMAERPFCTQHLYWDSFWLENPGISSKFFPTQNHKNIVISIAKPSSRAFSILISNNISEYHYVGDTQCFPLYYYEEAKKDEMHLYGAQEGYVRKSGLSAHIMHRARELYGKVTEGDVFYYVYGALHSLSYRQKYAADLKRMLPHLPLLPKEQFFAFSKAGRKLADLHLEYESQKPLAAVRVVGDTGDYAVQKMRFAKAGRAQGRAEAASKEDKSVILYNSSISIHNIPAEAYRYVVNGRPAIEWVMERYQLKTDKDSGITNDPNLWAAEQGKPRYILDLLLSVITLSVKSMEIIDGLPNVAWE